MKACLDTSTCPCTNMFFKCESSIPQVVNASKIGFLTGQGRPSKEKLDIILSYNLYHACQAVSTSELLSVKGARILHEAPCTLNFCFLQKNRSHFILMSMNDSYEIARNIPNMFSSSEYLVLSCFWPWRYL